MPPNPHCTLVGNTDFNELPPDIQNIKTKDHPTHTSQSNSSSVTHHCMSQLKSSAAPLPRVSKLMSSAAVHRTSQPKSSAALPPPHVSKTNKSYTKGHHQPQKPQNKPVVSAPNKSNERPNKNPHIWPFPWMTYWPFPWMTYWPFPWMTYQRSHQKYPRQIDPRSSQPMTPSKPHLTKHQCSHPKSSFGTQPPLPPRT
jgi:hypothetical protein